MPLFQVFVETPGNSRVKYKYDPDSRILIVKKTLPLGLVFPFDFGFIPHTVGQDGDPLDAMIISAFQTLPGCQVTCRLIGMMEAKQTQGREMVRNDRFFFVPENSLVYKHVKTIRDLPAQMIKELQVFFITYNQESQKQFKPLKVIGASQSEKILKKQMKE